MKIILTQEVYGIGATGESTKSKGWQAATVAARIARVWL